MGWKSGDKGTDLRKFSLPCGPENAEDIAAHHVVDRGRIDSRHPMQISQSGMMPESVVRRHRYPFVPNSASQSQMLEKGRENVAACCTPASPKEYSLCAAIKPSIAGPLLQRQCRHHKPRIFQARWRIN